MTFDKSYWESRKNMYAEETWKITYPCGCYFVFDDIGDQDAKVDDDGYSCGICPTHLEQLVKIRDRI